MERKFTIGEISKIFNLSKDTLRYYDSIDLIKPWAVGKNGYRYYNRNQFDMISTIIFLRNAGMPIKEIKQITTGDDIGMSAKKINHRKNRVKKRISELQQSLHRLDIIQENLNSIEGEFRISVKKIPELWLLSEEMTLLDELKVDEIGLIRDSRVREWVSYATVMSTIKPKSLLAGKFHEFTRYGYVSEHPFPFEDRHVIKIENQLYVCVNTVVPSNAYYKKDPAYERLLEYITTVGLAISGETIERTMFDLYDPEKNEYTHFYKVYVPVKDI